MEETETRSPCQVGSRQRRVRDAPPDMRAITPAELVDRALAELRMARVGRAFADFSPKPSSAPGTKSLRLDRRRDDYSAQRKPRDPLRYVGSSLTRLDARRYVALPLQ